MGMGDIEVVCYVTTRADWMLLERGASKFSIPSTKTLSLSLSKAATKLPLGCYISSPSRLLDNTPLLLPTLEAHVLSHCARN